MPLRMHRYRNLSGDSGVVAYALRPGAIRVEFRGGRTYTYTDATAGPQAVADMQVLARLGRGLSAYIAQHVADRYERPPG